jgi:hypothetical protein
MGAQSPKRSFEINYFYNISTYKATTNYNNLCQRHGLILYILRKEMGQKPLPAFGS